MSASLSPFPKFRPLDANGNIMPGFKLYTFLAGSTTPTATYTDASAATSNSNPVIGDANGEADVWLGNVSYKLNLTDSNDVQVEGWPVDNIAAGTNIVTTPTAVQTITGFALDVDEGFNGEIGGDTPAAGTFTTCNVTGQYQVNGVQINFTNIAGTVTSAQLPARTTQIAVTLDGAGATPATGIFFELPIMVLLNVTGWRLIADQIGSAQIDVKIGSYADYATTMSSIAGTDLPAISTAIKADQTDMSGWSRVLVNAGDILQFSLVSVTTCTRLTLVLKVSVPWS